MQWIGRLTAMVAAAGCLAAAPARAQYGAPDTGEWRSYAGDSGGTKYSPLDQITAENFGDLEVRWRWSSVDTHLVRSTPGGDSLVAADTLFDNLQADEPDLWTAWDGVRQTRTRPSIRSLVATPLMVDGVLYVSTPLYRAAAIDARTGETVWVHDPRAYESGMPAIAQWRHRGVAYWENDGDARIVWGTGDGFLVAVDAETGLPAADFGDNGRIDLTDGVPRATRGERDVLNLLALSSQSPPMILRDTIVIGSTINDRTITREATPGWARAYDIRTGRHRWDFHTVPQSADEFGSDTWLNESWRYSGNTNIWSMMSGDEELGWVYLPIGTPTNDYYGGHRPGDNLFAESIVAVDVETGQRQWHFQTIHHGLWDYDLPAAPNLLDITVDGREIKAVAQVSKQGFVYVFDRVTGEPVWPIEELPVATDTDLVGEVMSPTQPFPTRPAAFEYQGTSIDDLVDFTPEIRQMAVDAVQGFRLGPLYTPQTLRGTIMRPPVGGGASWSGAAVDPRDRLPLRAVDQRPLDDSAHRARGARAVYPALHPPLGLGRPRHAARAAVVEAALHPHDRHRHEHRRARLDGPHRRRRPHPQPPHAARPRPAARGGRRQPQRSAAHQDAADLRPDRGRQRRRAAARGLRQGDRGGDRVGRPARRGPRGAHDLPARRRAAHRADRRRRGAGTHLVPTPGVNLAMTTDMGEISVDFELENPVDRENFERGLGDESRVRRTRVQGIVDTGAMMLVLPGSIVERLGLRVQETVVVTYADNRREERPVAGPVTVRIGDRSTRTDCVVGPPSGEVLIGQIILEALDLIADCSNRTLTPRMPDYPVLKLRQFHRSTAAHLAARRARYDSSRRVAT